MAYGMKVVGLTGGIAMGKSTVAAQFAALGARVICADAITHALLAENGLGVAAVSALFPEARMGNAIDRAKLGAVVFSDPRKLAELEAVLHPLVMAEEQRFVERARMAGAAVAVMDIPLLFETGGEKRCDVTVVASAPAWMQRRRALKRPGMTEEKLARILARQLSDTEKRRRADFVVCTGLGKALSAWQVRRIMRKIMT